MCLENLKLDSEEKESLERISRTIKEKKGEERIKAINDFINDQKITSNSVTTLMLISNYCSESEEGNRENQNN